MQEFNGGEREMLLETARNSIAYGFKYQKPIPVHVMHYPEHLRDPRASFVTLKLDGLLRGCIGSLEAYRPLIEDISHNAFAAAFQDPRFYPLTPEEFKRVNIHLSILSKPENLAFDSQEDLLSKLRPNVDGLVLYEGFYKGTFLPAVWEELTDRRDFLNHLKMKAGLPEDYWSDSIHIERYTAEAIP